MKMVFLAQFILLLAGTSVLALLVGWREASSYGSGAVMMGLNLGILAWLWGRIVKKKQIALALVVIVFKYAILGLILYKILSSPWLEPIWFCVGIGTLMVSLFAVTLMTDTETGEIEGSPTGLSKN